MLLASCPLIAPVLVSNGFITRLISILACGNLSVRIAAAKAVNELAYTSMKTRKELGECGCIPPLIMMLEGKAVEERQSAAMALSSLMVYPPNRRIFAKEERGILNAVQLLDPSLHNLDKKYPISLLAAIVHSKRCRKKMIAAGAYTHLQKLNESEVEGSKKLLESLRKNKIWGVFAR